MEKDKGRMQLELDAKVHAPGDGPSTLMSLSLIEAHIHQGL